MLQKLWYDRPVRTQLLVAVGLINLLAALFAVSVRSSTPGPRPASRSRRRSKWPSASSPPPSRTSTAQAKVDQLREQLPLQLKHLRHVRILFMDQIGQLTVCRRKPASDERTRRRRAGSLLWCGRSWSAAPCASSPRALESRSSSSASRPTRSPRPGTISTRSRSSGSCSTLSSSACFMSCSAACSIRSPISRAACGSSRTATTRTRLATPKVKELAVITNRFNTLAGALDIAREENSRLYRQLISVQEEERREIANELHDEAGPCLFGITANASSIQNHRRSVDGRAAPSEIRHRVGEILGIVERLKLHEPRSAEEAAARIAWARRARRADRRARSPASSAVIPARTSLYSAGRLAKSYGEPIDLTLYRCIQEGITNAIRHGNAESLTIDLVEESGHRRDGAKRRADRVAPDGGRRRQGDRSGDAEGLRTHHHDRAGDDRSAAPARSRASRARAPSSTSRFRSQREQRRAHAPA